ncbi:MAG: DUF488 domain-containing protein [Sphaerochaeta sp.]|nr:DUF488 domain-containing protein [Sphaerochaeta sp.]
MVKIKQVYEPFDAEDGERYLVDRLWPRGMSKEKLRLDAWLKDVAPSGDLRRWFGHDEARWEEFQSLYRSELDSNPDGWKPLAEACRRGKVTLLFAAHDREHNNAQVLKAYVEEHMG